MKNDQFNRPLISKFPKTQTEPLKIRKNVKWPSWQAVDRVNAQRWRPVGSVGTQHSIWPPPGQCWFQQNDEILDQCFCQNNKDTLHPQGITLSKYRKFIFMGALCSLKEWYNSCASQRQRWENVNYNSILQQDMNTCFCSGLHKHSRI